MKAETVEQLKSRVRKNKISSWNQLHDAYVEIGEEYAAEKLQHAVASMLEIKDVNLKNFTGEQLAGWLNGSVSTMEWQTEQIRRSREKDYKNPFRQMTYQSFKEMDAVVGSLEDNSFINQTTAELVEYKNTIEKTIREWEL